MSRRTRIALAAAVAALSLAVAVVPASADVTIGQTGGEASNCGATILIGDTSYVVPPGGGTITSFSFESIAANTGQTLDFLVLRLTGTPNSYTVVGKTGLVTLAGTGLETFTANIPVQSGDILGFWLGSNFPNCIRVGGGYIQTNDPTPVDPSVGDTHSFPTNGLVNLNLSANLVTGPTSKAQCKNGGWKNFGSMFKNQGSCVTLFDT